MTKGVEDGISDRSTQKDWETIANHVGIPYERVGAFFGVAEMCGYRWTRVDPQPAAVPEAPTFAYQLAMYLTRNGADAPHMQAEISLFMHVNGWQVTRKGSK